jgi:hypothetical protein
MSNPRIWLVTARNADGKFIDQRRIEAFSQETAENDAYNWIENKGGSQGTSTVKEVK